MTEIFEVKDFQTCLLDIKEGIEYESKTRPGEGAVVVKYFDEASHKIDDAVTALKAAEAVMKNGWKGV